MNAQTALDDESEKGGVTEGAYVRLSKCLKDVHDEKNTADTALLASYLLKQALVHPKSIAFVPEFTRTIVIEKVAFFRCLLTLKKREVNGVDDKEWSTDLLSSLIPHRVHSPEDSDYAQFRKLVGVVIQARGYLMPLERFLDDTDTYPHLVCPEPLGYGQLDRIPAVLIAEPSFLWWLLNPGTVDDFYYDDREVLRLQESAFINRHKVYTPEYMPRLVAGLGLRGPDDLEAIASRIREHGEIFAEAKEHVITNSGDYCGTPMELPARPRDYLWQI